VTGPRVTFEDVSLVLGGYEVLDSVSFSVAPGEIHAVVGPNGGGKTSLIRALLGQMPHKGTIRIEGEETRPIGYAPQFLEFDRTLPLTVADVMAVMRQRRPAFFGTAGHVRRDGLAALEKMQIAYKWEARFGGLSGGERQRVLVAQALLPAPRLLVLDEATSNMDEAGSRLTETLVKDLSAQGTTVLWINHDWAQVRRVADTVTGINRTVTFSGRPADVLPALPNEAA